MKMKLSEFVSKYFKGQKEKQKTTHDLLDSELFTYDELLEEENGETYKAITCESGPVKLEDIFGLNEMDFKNYYPHSDQWEARVLYLDNFVIIAGEELMYKVQKEMSAAMERIQKYNTKYTKDLLM